MQEQKTVRKHGGPKIGIDGRFQAYVPTDAQRNIVQVLSGFAVAQDRIAKLMEIDLTTLTKHYRKELDNGSIVVESKLIGNLLRIAAGSDGTALKAIMFVLQCRYGWSQYAPPPVERPEQLGKKEQLVREAHTGHRATSWGELLQ